MTEPTVFNAAKPDWTCPFCRTHHGEDLDAAQRCAAAGPTDDRGPLAVAAPTLGVLTPTRAKPFTHEVLYGNTLAADLVRPFPQVNLLAPARYRLASSDAHDKALTEVPIVGTPRDLEQDQYRNPLAPRRIRPVTDRRSGSDGWFGPIGERGVEVLEAARTRLIQVPAVTGGSLHESSSYRHYPYFDPYEKRTSNLYGGQFWPDAHRAVAEAATGSEHDVVLVRWLHLHGPQVSAWLLAQFAVWVAGGDATIPAFHTGCGAIDDKAPGVRRATVLARVAYDTDGWGPAEFAELKSDRRLGRDAQHALLSQVHTDVAPAIELEKL